MYKIIKSEFNVYNKPLREYTKLSISSIDKVIRYRNRSLGDIIDETLHLKPMITVMNDINLDKLFGSDMEL